MQVDRTSTVQDAIVMVAHFGYTPGMPPRLPESPFTFTGPDGPYAWITERVIDRHGGRWRAAFRVAVREGQVVVAEVRAFPDPADAEAGRSGEWGHELAAVPVQGLDARTVKQIRLGRVPAWVLATLSSDAQHPDPHWRKISGVMNQFMLPGAETVTARPRPRRATGRDDRFYAALAAEYTTVIASGERHPVKALAARRGESSAHIRDWLHEARVRGLLSLAQPGVAGGLLLPAARALVGRSAPIKARRATTSSQPYTQRRSRADGRTVSTRQRLVGEVPRARPAGVRIKPEPTQGRRADAAPAARGRRRDRRANPAARRSHRV